MAPNLVDQTGALFEEEAKYINTENISKLQTHKPRKIQLVWRNIILFSFLHLAAVYGLYLSFTSVKWQTNLFALLFFQLGVFGITAGAHRLWAHRSYKAKWPLRLFLTICNTMAFQDAVIDWARDHRVHHKFSETDADPHNATRGFFFSHVGWLLCRKHPDIKLKGKQIDLSDLYEDPILRFQKKHYLKVMPIFCFIIPTFVPWYFWNESFYNSWYVPTLLRYCINLNITWLVNSAAHMWGNKPYDKYISPVQNKIVAILASGEGWHNYHHTFPWDYKTSELGTYAYNFTTALIDFCSKLGVAYEMKTVSPETVKKRTLRTGDGSHELWGWGDADQPQEERDEAIVIGRKSD